MNQKRFLRQSEQNYLILMLFKLLLKEFVGLKICNVSACNVQSNFVQKPLKISVALVRVWFRVYARGDVEEGRELLVRVRCASRSVSRGLLAALSSSSSSSSISSLSTRSSSSDSSDSSSISNLTKNIFSLRFKRFTNLPIVT